MSVTRADTRHEGIAGVLFQYKSQLQAFESGPLLSERKLVVLGGLSDGMLACPYVPQLGASLAEEGWSIVQPNIRSSYMQWGFGSLNEDVEDLTALLDFLVAHRNAKTLAICGHSTGSQICAHLMRTRPHPAVSHVILQGGVSDRESDDPAVHSSRIDALALARTISASSSGGQEMMPRATSWAPITAQRYLDLNEKGGSDDYFSSDLDDSQLAVRFSGFYARTNVLLAYSGEDEYVPQSVDKPLLVRRLRDAMASGRGSGSSGSGTGSVVVPVIVGLVIKGADHALYKSADQFVNAAAAFLNGRPVPDALV
jgi:pimeloyl-ACP methyl ester carboxylesterase